MGAACVGAACVGGRSEHCLRGSAACGEAAWELPPAWGPRLRESAACVGAACVGTACVEVAAVGAPTAWKQPRGSHRRTALKNDARNTMPRKADIDTPSQ